MDKKLENKVQLGFAAINPILVDNIVSPEEKGNGKNKWIIWGDGNKYPSYLYGLYCDVPTLHSIVDSLVDYIIGDGITSNTPMLSDKKALKLAKSIAKSIVIYGGCVLNVLRNRKGDVAMAKPLDFRCVRSNKDNSLLFYSEQFRDTKTYWSKGMVTEFPSFKADAPEELTSIYMYKNTEYQTYPSPMYAASVISCELERKINEYFINSISNNFVSNVIINLNNGVPSDEQKVEIEKNFSEKFCGSQNAGRPVLAFNDDKDHQATIQQVKTDDWAEKFTELKKRTKEEIFTVFRMNPNLVGIATEGTGFAGEEYESAFKLFNRTVILPLQQEVCGVIDDIFGEGSITIEPFNIDFDGNKQDVEEVENNDVTIVDNE